MSGLLVAVAGGAIGGALGALVARRVVNAAPERWRKNLVSLIAIAIGIVCSRGAVAVFESWQRSPAAIESALLADPNMGSLARAWREADPASYRDFSRGLGDAAASGANQDAAANVARAHIMAAAVPRTLFLGDTEMLESAHISREQFLQLGRNRADRCRPLFAGEPFGDITPFVDPSLPRRELALLEAAFRADTSRTRPTAIGPSFEALLARVLANTQIRVGNDVLMLTGEADATGRDAAFCAAAVAFYDSIIALPPPEGAAFLRGMRAPR